MKKKISLILIFCLIISIVPTAFASDNNIDKRCYILNKMNVLEGKGNGDYDLNSYLTRAEFAKLSMTASPYRDLIPKNTNTSPFFDVKSSNWAAGYIKTASLNNIISGYPDSTFRPDNKVLLEEAVTIILKLLGYTYEDFKDDWPLSQLSIAKNTGLLDFVDKNKGEYITRKDAVNLIYNMLNTKIKGTKYIEKTNYNLIDDVILISSYKEQKNLNKDEVITSVGKLKLDSGFDFTKVGKRGTALIKENDKLVGFYPDDEIKETYPVMGVLENDIVLSTVSGITSFDIESDTDCYYNTEKTSYDMILQKAKTGDSLSVAKDSKGNIKYVILKSEKLEGPVTVLSKASLNIDGIDKNNVIIIKQGGRVSINDINTYDILYYSKNLNTIWVYSDKRTGIYERAIPNQEFPKSIVLSGVEYPLETATALSKLNSQGQFKLGSSVTLLLGKEGKICDVISPSYNNDVIYGYVLDTGTKSFTEKDKNYTSYYVDIVTPKGDLLSYITDRNYENYKCRVVKIKFDNSVASLQSIEGKNIEGTFDAYSYSFGGRKVARDVGIIDVKEGDTTRKGEFIKVYPETLNNVKIDKNKVLYYDLNNEGEISSLILNDVTGDNYEYGIIIKADEYKGTEYMVDGNIRKTRTFFTVGKRTPVKLDIYNNDLDGVTPLQNFGTVDKITVSYVINDKGDKMPLSDRVSIYLLNNDYDYMLKTVDEIIENKDKYKLTAYIDKSKSSGGKVRIITAKLK